MYQGQTSIIHASAHKYENYLIGSRADAEIEFSHTYVLWSFKITVKFCLEVRYLIIVFFSTTIGLLFKLFHSIA